MRQRTNSDSPGGDKDSRRMESKAVFLQNIRTASHMEQRRFPMPAAVVRTKEVSPEARQNKQSRHPRNA